MLREIITAIRKMDTSRVFYFLLMAEILSVCVLSKESEAQKAISAVRN